MSIFEKLFSFRSGSQKEESSEYSADFTDDEDDHAVIDGALTSAVPENEREDLIKKIAEGSVTIPSKYIKYQYPIEMWEILGHNNTIAFEAWPTYDEAKCQDNDVTYAVSVNGKVRDTLKVAVDTSKEDIEKSALSLEKVKAQLEGKQIVKIIVVPNKIVNIVVK